MALVRAEEPIDWSAIVAEHGGLVWRTADCILRNRADVEDCFQETFVAAVKLARRKQIQNWPATLRHIATARAIDRLRQRTAQRRFVSSARLAAVAIARDDPSPQVESAELAERLRTAIGRLPPRYAEVFCLHSLIGQTDAEIAGTLDISPGSVRVLLHRARTKLKALLKIEE